MSVVFSLNNKNKPDLSGCNLDYTNKEWVDDITMFICYNRDHNKQVVYNILKNMSETKVKKMLKLISKLRDYSVPFAKFLNYKGSNDLKMYQNESVLLENLSSHNYSNYYKAIYVNLNLDTTIKFYYDFVPKGALLWYSSAYRYFLDNNLIPNIDYPIDVCLTKPYDMKYERRFFNVKKDNNIVTNDTYKSNNIAYWYSNPYIGPTLHEILDDSNLYTGITDQILFEICKAIDICIYAWKSVGMIHGNLSIDTVRLCKLDKSYKYSCGDLNVHSKYLVVPVNYDNMTVTKNTCLDLKDCNDSIYSDEKLSGSYDFYTFYLSLLYILVKNNIYKDFSKYLFDTIYTPLYTINKSNDFGLQKLINVDKSIKELEKEIKKQQNVDKNQQNVDTSNEKLAMNEEKPNNFINIDNPGLIDIFNSNLDSEYTKNLSVYGYCKINSDLCIIKSNKQLMYLEINTITSARHFGGMNFNPIKNNINRDIDIAKKVNIEPVILLKCIEYTFIDFLHKIHVLIEKKVEDLEYQKDIIKYITFIDNDIQFESNNQLIVEKIHMINQYLDNLNLSIDGLFDCLSLQQTDKIDKILEAVYRDICNNVSNIYRILYDSINDFFVIGDIAWYDLCIMLMNVCKYENIRNQVQLLYDSKEDIIVLLNQSISDPKVKYTPIRYINLITSTPIINKLSDIYMVIGVKSNIEDYSSRFTDINIELSKCEAKNLELTDLIKNDDNYFHILTILSTNSDIDTLIKIHKESPFILDNLNSYLNNKIYCLNRSIEKNKKLLDIPWKSKTNKLDIIQLNTMKSYISKNTKYLEDKINKYSSLLLKLNSKYDELTPSLQIQNYEIEFDKIKNEFLIDTENYPILNMSDNIDDINYDNLTDEVKKELNSLIQKINSNIIELNQSIQDKKPVISHNPGMFNTQPKIELDHNQFMDVINHIKQSKNKNTYVIYKDISKYIGNNYKTIENIYGGEGKDNPYIGLESLSSSYLGILKTLFSDPKPSDITNESSGSTLMTESDTTIEVLPESSVDTDDTNNLSTNLECFILPTNTEKVDINIIKKTVDNIDEFVDNDELTEYPDTKRYTYIVSNYNKYFSYKPWSDSTSFSDYDYNNKYGVFLFTTQSYMNLDTKNINKIRTNLDISNINEKKILYQLDIYENNKKNNETRLEAICNLIKNSIATIGNFPNNCVYDNSSIYEISKYIECLNEQIKKYVSNTPDKLKENNNKINTLNTKVSNLINNYIKDFKLDHKSHPLSMFTIKNFTKTEQKTEQKKTKNTNEIEGIELKTINSSSDSKPQQQPQTQTNSNNSVPSNNTVNSDNKSNDQKASDGTNESNKSSLLKKFAIGTGVTIGAALTALAGYKGVKSIYNLVTGNNLSYTSEYTDFSVLNRDIQSIVKSAYDKNLFDSMPSLYTKYSNKLTDQYILNTKPISSVDDYDNYDLKISLKP